MSQESELQVIDSGGNAIAQQSNSVPANPWIGMIQQAVEKNMEISTIEKFIALQREEEDRQAYRAFSASKSSLQGAMPEISKSGNAKFQSGKGGISYDYDKLGDICSAIRPLLESRGLSYSWETAQNQGWITVKCSLRHALGHVESCELTAQADGSGAKNAIQQIGSTITYLQRYTLKAILGLASIDDDGAASDSVKAEQQAKVEFVKWQASAKQVMDRQSSIEELNDWYSKAIGYAGQYNQKFVVELEERYNEIKKAKGWK